MLKEFLVIERSGALYDQILWRTNHHKYSFLSVYDTILLSFLKYVSLIWTHNKNLPKFIFSSSNTQISPPKSQIIFRIFICFLPSNKITELSTKHEAITRIEILGWANQLTSMTSSAYDPFHSFPVYWTFLKGKREFWDSQNSLHFRETHFQNSELRTKISLKNFISYTL